MKTFEEIFCEEQSCQPEQFCHKLFWQTVPMHAVPFVFLLGGLDSPFFAADLKLLESLRGVQDMNDVRWRVNDYLADSADRGWLRRFLGAEISLWRLTIFARYHLPGHGLHSANPFYAFSKIES